MCRRHQFDTENLDDYKVVRHKRRAKALKTLKTFKKHLTEAFFYINYRLLKQPQE